MKLTKLRAINILIINWVKSMQYNSPFLAITLYNYD